MKPVIVHRYSWHITEAIEALLGDAAGDAKSWRIRVEGDELVVDIVAPDLRLTPEQIAESCPLPPAETSEAASVPAEEHAAEQPKPERKGGPLARSAAIIGSEKGFWTFAKQKRGVDIASAEEAGAWLRKVCGIESRADLDHDARAADIFRPIEKAYRLWLEGYD
ncbi:hypothetical protein GGQ99_004724 [Aminobacter niigataensis]|uniref:Uncharacterized protein n=1 Tax=Aminobacter niigataensis TaxID=83265 RepID=A0ABR6L816_9HYPH|nr:hypothetical protein [Aminobacter niigataensis]MBB4652940.1 hypothetical protein [Aminobacter niigataensis]